MRDAPRQTSRTAIGSLAAIAVVVAVGAAAFAYTAGWLSPNRLTPQRMVDAFSPPSGPALGHRRNHAKGICFTGMFESNGAGSELSRAFAFSKGSYPVVGRFNLGTPDADAADATVRVRGLGVQISAPDGQEWRMALINPPFFAVSNRTASSRSCKPRRARTRTRCRSLSRFIPRLRISTPGRRARPGLAATPRSSITASTPSSSPTPPAPRIPCAGRCFPRPSPFRSRWRNLRSAGRISSRRRSCSGSRADRRAGRWP